jgi:hypothetical protein
MAKDTSDPKAILKKADPRIRRYVAELDMRFVKLQRVNIKLEADKTERDSQIKALKQEMTIKKTDVHLNLAIGDLSSISEERFVKELKKAIPRLIAMAPKLGLKITRA